MVFFLILGTIVVEPYNNYYMRFEINIMLKTSLLIVSCAEIYLQYINTNMVSHHQIIQQINETKIKSFGMSHSQKKNGRRGLIPPFLSFKKSLSLLHTAGMTPLAAAALNESNSLN